MNNKVIFSTIMLLIFFTSVAAGYIANDEYIMSITIDSNENVTFANHTSAADGNWINLTNGTVITLPSFTFIYSGNNTTSYVVNGRDISVHLNVESNEEYKVEYPFSTHPMYTNVSSNNIVNMSYNGSSHFANEGVDIYLIKTAPTSLKDAFDNITGGNTTLFRNLLNESVNKSLNCPLDSEGDTAYKSFGPLDAGDYVVVLLLNSSYLPNVNDLSILSATAFMVLEYESEVSVASAVYVDDILPVSITVNASDGEYTYGAILVHSDAYQADVRLTCNGSKDLTNLTVDGAYLIQGYQITGTGLSNVNCNTVQGILETIIGPNNGTVSYKNTNTNTTTISLTTNDLRVGEYILITAVYKSGELLVALNQSEISISDDYTPPPSSSSGGGGSSGVIGSGEAFKNILVSETNRQIVTKDAKVSFNFKLEQNIIKYLNFTGKTNLGNIAVKVEILDNLSTQVDKTPPGLLYKCLNIYLGIPRQDSIADPTIIFRIDKAWFSENSIDELGLTVYHYSGEEWDPLVISRISEDAEYVYYEAEINSFSVFAITGSNVHVPNAETTEEGIVDIPGVEVVGEEEPVDQLPAKEKEGIPGFGLFSGIFVFLIIVHMIRNKK